MCGITGIWNLDDKPVNHEVIDPFTDSLSHRGPDGRGTYINIETGIALGHRRLAILDTSDSGKQPMSYMDGRYWITFNGEIFNFLELRIELIAKGYCFHTQSDTEVIMAAYNAWGHGMLQKFNGMWAFAIFDKKEQTLFIARDRFGIKPFHYLMTSKCFAFASELKAFKFLNIYHPQIDEESAQLFLQDPSCIEGSTRTLFRGIRRLQGGYYGILKNKNFTILRWWNTLEHLITPPETIRQQAEEFYSLFYDSTKLRMRSDVPIATCLSGGFDSTSVVCTLAKVAKESRDHRQAKECQHAFIATFPGCANDERSNAEKTIEFTGINGHFFPSNSEEALNNISRVLYDFDDPCAGVPTSVWLLYRELRRSQKVVSLDGHGADELMGGYFPLGFLDLYDAPNWFTSPKDNIQRLRPYLKGSNSGYSKLFKATKLTILNHPDFSFIRGPIMGSMNTIKKIRKQDITNFFNYMSAEVSDDFSLVGSQDILPSNWGNYNKLFYKMFHSNTLPTILRNFDRMSMAHGIEIRMPFMDWRLVTFVMSLPEKSKINKGFTKYIAREAMINKIPESIRTSKEKIGFSSPLPEWFNGPLKHYNITLLNDPSFNNHWLINIDRLRRYIISNNNNQSWNLGTADMASRYINYLWFENEFLKK